MRYFERHGGQRALRPIVFAFIRADPELAMLAAYAVAPPGWTESPSIGWPSKALPVAVQSFRSPVSKSRFSTRPSAAVAANPSSGLTLASALGGQLGAAGGWAGQCLSGIGWAASQSSVDVLRLVREDERTFFVSDNDIVPFVAVDIANDNLRADARVVVDLVRNEVDGRLLRARFEPVQDRGIEGAGVIARSAKSVYR